MGAARAPLRSLRTSVVTLLLGSVRKSSLLRTVRRHPTMVTFQHAVWNWGSSVDKGASRTDAEAEAAAGEDAGRARTCPQGRASAKGPA